LSLKSSTVSITNFGFGFSLILLLFILIFSNLGALGSLLIKLNGLTAGWAGPAAFGVPIPPIAPFLIPVFLLNFATGLYFITRPFNSMGSLSFSICPS